MQSEIEVKFLNVNHDDIRDALRELGAERDHPMRIMKRVMLDHSDSRYQKGNLAERLRIRDEGDKITVTYKASNNTNYPYEVEIKADSFDEARNLFKALGFIEFSFQESKREAWHYKDVEIVLDEWPWLKPYIEIEGPTEESIQSVATELGFSWNQARFGSVDTAYIAEYTKMTKQDSIGQVAEVRFANPVPDYLRRRQE